MQTLEEALKGLNDDIRWFQREAERQALRASRELNFAIKVSAMHEQEKCLSIRNKLSEWYDRFAKCSLSEGDNETKQEGSQSDERY